MADEYWSSEKEVIEKNKSIQTEEQISQADGSIKTKVLNKFPLHNSSGEIIGLGGIAHDITDVKKANNELHAAIRKEEESNDRFNKAMQATSDGLWDWNLITNEIYFSPRWKAMLGYRDDELANDFSVWEKLTKPEDVRRSWDLLNALIEGKEKKFDVEFKMKHKKGHWIDINSRANVFRNEEGKAVRCVGTHTDITERKQAEKRLKESEAMLKAALDNSQAGIAIAEVPSGKLKYVNKAGLHIRGKDYEELAKDIDIEKYVSSWQIMYFDGTPYKPEDVPLARAVLTGETVREEFVIRRDDFEDRYVLAHAAPINDENGERIAAIVVFLDITERIKVEKNINSISRRLQLSTESANIGIWEFDLKNNVLNWDKRMFELYGIASKDFDGAYEAWQKGLHPDDIRRADKEVQDAIAGTKDFHSQFRVVWPNGQIRHIEAHAIVTHDQDEKPESMVGVNWDITHIKDTEISLIDAKLKAEESDRLKSAFLSNMSHEIRTPMNGILGFTGLLKEPNLSGNKQEEYIRIIEKSGNRMLNTINDIVDISKIEAGQVEISNKELSVSKLLSDLNAFFAQEADAKGIKLIYNSISEDDELCMISDQHKLESILTNLIKNAVKYTLKGNISFGCEIQYSKGKEACEFYVKDTGIGIPENRIDAIFNRFEQADIEDTDAFEGSGLGLAITKSYVEMMDGSIDVTSIQGQGSTFTVRIPCHRPNRKDRFSTPNSEVFSEERIMDLSVIVADDDETSRMYFAAVLSKRIENIIYTSTGRETIEQCRKNPNIDIILMDIKMPDIDGYNTTKEIRKFNRDVIIIAQTAHALQGDKEKAIEAGCDDHISKPIQKNLLFEKIRRSLNHKYKK